MTIYVTRWALQNGAIVRYDNAEAVTVKGRKGDRRCAVVRSHRNGRHIKFWPREWHPTAEAARTHAVSLRSNTRDRPTSWRPSRSG